MSFPLIPLVARFSATRNNTNFPSFNCNAECFMNSFFPNVINESNKLDIKITNITSHNAFKNSLLSFIQPFLFHIFRIHISVGLQLLTKLWLALSHFNERKFKHNFCDFLNPPCACNWNQRQHPTICYAASFSK